MHILSAGKKRIALDLLERPPAEFAAGQPGLVGFGTFAKTSSVARASRAFVSVHRGARGER